MARRAVCFVLMACVLMLTSCQRAKRFPAVAKAEPDKTPTDEPDRGLYRLGWAETAEGNDVPIVFVPDTDPEWQHLAGFWTSYPPIPLYLAQNPLQALTAIVWTDKHRAIKIKVPRGLPDPTPFVPKSNPLMHGQWLLGKALFHEPRLPVGSDFLSCASCHRPHKGFTDGKPHSEDGRYNTLSLINVVYNRRQFWDGRVKTLEETLVRSVDDERQTDPVQARERALARHNFGGFVRTLAETKAYNERFRLVFGIEQPTQDTVARALATYMRTLLAGDSLFDRAGKYQEVKDNPHKHFVALLDRKDAGVVLPDEPDKKLTRDDLTAIARGAELFFGKARCAQCHGGPLFTDTDFHNVGTNNGTPDDENWPAFGKETGYAAHLPIGLKEARYLGAFRTPTLRNLVKTEPYLRDGSQYTLLDAVNFFADGTSPAPRLDPALKDVGNPQRLELSKAQKDELVLFLRALEGTPLDSILTEK
jgi:cytochrome c peroxidase